MAGIIMASTSPSSKLPPISQEHRKIAAERFKRANEVIATGGFEYGIRLLLTCCTLDPGNLPYRQTLRRTEKAKYRNNLRGSLFAWLTSAGPRARMKAALRTRDYKKVLECGEMILRKNPWDIGAQMDMAVACENLGLLDMAVWTLEQARQKAAADPTVNRALAQLYEKVGKFAQAMRLWEQVHKARPTDAEAANKAKDLAASDTIARGKYEAAVSGEPPPEEGAPAAAAADGAEAARSAGTPTARKPITAPAIPGTPVGPDRVTRDANPIKAKIEADPSNINNYLQLASIHRRANDLDAARALLQSGLGPTGNAWELIVALAEVDTDTFRHDLAITENKLKADPEDASLLTLRDQQRKEVWSRELEVYRRKAERYPTELVHRYEVGVRLFRLGQTDEAIKELQTARSDPRFRWQSLFHLGRCFKVRNNWRLAQRNLEDALKEIPVGETEQRKDLLYDLATGCADAGDFPRAVEVGHELANLDFGFRDIAQLLEEWEVRLEK
jgi:tetratricopeptide (TPR) repeat protein